MAVCRSWMLPGSRSGLPCSACSVCQAFLCGVLVCRKPAAVQASGDDSLRRDTGCVCTVLTVIPAVLFETPECVFGAAAQSPGQAVPEEAGVAGKVSQESKGELSLKQSCRCRIHSSTPFAPSRELLLRWCVRAFDSLLCHGSDAARAHRSQRPERSKSSTRSVQRTTSEWWASMT